jgi:hypothetical protein
MAAELRRVPHAVHHEVVRHRAASLLSLSPFYGERVASGHEGVCARLRRAMAASRVRGNSPKRPLTRLASLGTLSPLRG